MTEKDKASYTKLARRMDKSAASLIINLYFLYHDVIDQGGERLNRIRATVAFGDEAYGKDRVTVLVAFTEDEQKMLYASAAAAGKTIRGYLVELVKYGLYKAGIADEGETEKSVPLEKTVPVKRGRGRPKGSKSKKRKDESVSDVASMTMIPEKESHAAEEPLGIASKTENPVNSVFTAQEGLNKVKPVVDSPGNDFEESMQESSAVQPETGSADKGEPEQDEEALRAIRRRKLLFNGLKDGKISLN